MNMFFKQMNVFVLCAAMVAAVPMYSMENEVADEMYAEEVVEQTPVTVWYKKPSVKFIATAFTTAAAAYAYAVYTGRISAPAFLVSLLSLKVAATAASNNSINNVVESNNNVVVQSAEQDKPSDSNNIRVTEVDFGGFVVELQEEQVAVTNPLDQIVDVLRPVGRELVNSAGRINPEDSVN